MVLYVGAAVLCTLALPLAYRRAGRHWTRYVVGTGAPLVLVLLILVSVLSIAVAAVDGALARDLFTGGLLGSGLTQFVLLRRTQGDDMRQGDDGRPVDPDTVPGAWRS